MFQRVFHTFGQTKHLPVVSDQRSGVRIWLLRWTCIPYMCIPPVSISPAEPMITSSSIPNLDGAPVLPVNEKSGFIRTPISIPERTRHLIVSISAILSAPRPCENTERRMFRSGLHFTEYRNRTPGKHDLRPDVSSMISLIIQVEIHMFFCKTSYGIDISHRLGVGCPRL